MWFAKTHVGECGEQPAMDNKDTATNRWQQVKKTLLLLKQAA